MAHTCNEHCGARAACVCIELVASVRLALQRVQLRTAAPALLTHGQLATIASADGGAHVLQCHLCWLQLLCQQARWRGSVGIPAGCVPAFQAATAAADMWQLRACRMRACLYMSKGHMRHIISQGMLVSTASGAHHHRVSKPASLCVCVRAEACNGLGKA
jgi:hypothetical protein